MRIIAFFNNKGGVGKTSLVYHLAHMYADQGRDVLAADLDPQANLTSMFLEEHRLEEIWPEEGEAASVYGAIQPLLDGIGDIGEPPIERIADNLDLIPGDLRLSSIEHELNTQWPDCLDRKPRAFRVISAFYRLLRSAAKAGDKELVLIDVGPNLGAINRAALICAEQVVIPLAPDIYSLQGLRNLGPALREWRTEWQQRLKVKIDIDLPLPSATMDPVGYVVLQHAVRLDRPIKSYLKWMARIPATYREYILEEQGDESVDVVRDPRCLAMLKHYRSLMPMAMEAHKPMFFLKYADGAIGSHIKAVQGCFDDFKELSESIYNPEPK